MEEPPVWWHETGKETRCRPTKAYKRECARAAITWRLTYATVKGVRIPKEARGSSSTHGSPSPRARPLGRALEPTRCTSLLVPGETQPDLQHVLLGSCGDEPTCVNVP